MDDENVLNGPSEWGKERKELLSLLKWQSAVIVLLVLTVGFVFMGSLLMLVYGV